MFFMYFTFTGKELRNYGEIIKKAIFSYETRKYLFYNLTDPNAFLAL